MFLLQKPFNFNVYIDYDSVFVTVVFLAQAKSPSMMLKEEKYKMVSFG